MDDFKRDNPNMKSETGSSMVGVSRRKVFLYGFFIWTFWVIFYMVFFKIQVGESWGVSFISSAFSYYVYGLLSILIWYICRSIPFNRHPIILLLSLHFLLSIVFSLLWLVLIYGLWYLEAGKRIVDYFPIREVIGWQFLFGMITYLLIAGIFYTIIYYKHFREKELREAELKLLTRDAEFKALKMQVNPHFLFNVLNSINALVTEDPQQAREMIARVSDLLRLSLENKDKMMVPLKEELDFAHLYLDIERIRFKDRLDYQETVDPQLLSVSFPGMVLQPLFENGIKYGVASKRGRGSLRLELKERNGRIECVMSNSVDKGTSNSVSSKSNGTGLQNIRRRLDLIYEGNYDFEAGYSDSGNFRVKLVVPIGSDG